MTRGPRAAAQRPAPPPAAGAAGETLRVMAVAQYFLPGYKAGGPVRTLSNLTRLLGDEVEFAMLTGDRDIGDAEPYPDVARDAWTERDGIAVRYVSPGARSLDALEAALREREYDVLYLNSLWSVFTRRVLLLRRLGRLPDRPVVLAPRGELAAGALRQKTERKLAFLAFAHAAGLLRGVVWQATSEAEVRDIVRWARPRAPALLAPNPSLPFQGGGALARPPKAPGELRAIFLARVCRSKNLLDALEALREVEGRVTFDIYGTLEREDYWARCRHAIAALPANVACAYHGPVLPDRVEETLSRYHVFLLPTVGENFGHGVVEAMRAGCPPLISDRTPWRGLAAARAGWDVPLGDIAAMRAALAEAVAMDGPTWEGWAAGARAFAEAAVRSDASRDAHLRLFRHARRSARSA